MYNLIVYGSLLNPKELQKHNISSDRIKHVKVNGYKRIFNQEPSWRKIDSIHRAVMNIEPHTNSWFNALLITDLDQNYIIELDHRERGYNRIVLSKETVKDYNENQIENCIVYQGKNSKQNNTILPQKEYFTICLEGANSHFKEFYEDYLATTYWYNKRKLESIKTFQ